ncbi:hypothetical protein PG994_005308 [Apiospora phragmitis]|uniref:Mitochondrial zinc maintenance protein 1, mitochondrial n=1 Tax=Apiospora phragmitis TaxID=2905665 RepID=A0ABR1VCV8_9PEZI
MPVKWTSSSQFVPARNSRHRTACLALYKALLTVAPKVCLPTDLATAWGTKYNPVSHHVRNAFRRNRADTSPRLVYPALQAGYRMLALLSRAAAAPPEHPPSPSSPSPEQAAVEAFLRARLSERNATLAAKALHPPNSRNPRKPTPVPHEATRPLLVRVSPPPTPEDPYPTPKYAAPSRPLPRSELQGTGRRQIPRLEMAGDFPFLRLTKPQPALLSRVLHQKIKKRVERIAAWTQFKEEDMLDAQEEDDWERVLGKLSLAKKVKRQETTVRRESARLSQRPNTVASIEGDAETYETTIREHGLQHLSDVLNHEREDSVARADAMRDLIKAETELRLREKEDRRLERRRIWEGQNIIIDGDEVGEGSEMMLAGRGGE